jgi:glycosyltransferase involved in cell wall biosynthesis
VRKRLVILIPKLSGGGVARVISYLSSLAPSDYEVVIVLFKKENSYNTKSRIYVLRNNYYGGALDRIKSIIEVYRILHRERAEAVLGCKKDGRNIALLQMFSKPFIRIEAHPKSPPIFGLRGKLPYFLKTRILYRRARKIIVISAAIKQYFMENYGLPSSKIVVIYNPCDVKSIRTHASEVLDKQEEKFFEINNVLISVSRLSKEKGQHHLIRVFRHVNGEIPNTRLILVGDGPLRPYLEKLISDLCLEGKALILGWRSNPFKYMARSTLFCLSSTREGFPNVVVESLSCGLPVMSADCLSGPREILAPGTEYKVERLREPEYGKYGILMPVMDGKLYTANDPLTWQEEVWAEEIIKLLKDPRPLEEYRRKALKRALDFDAEKQVKRYFDVIFESKNRVKTNDINK